MWDSGVWWLEARQPDPQSHLHPLPALDQRDTMWLSPRLSDQGQPQSHTGSTAVVLTSILIQPRHPAREGLPSAHHTEQLASQSWICRCRLKSAAKKALPGDGVQNSTVQAQVLGSATGGCNLPGSRESESFCSRGGSFLAWTAGESKHMGS